MVGCDYDLAVIGAGPGGYKCAVRAAKLGLKVVCIDKNALLGGTCLRVGCIPSKALLDYSYKYYAVKHHFPHVGISAKEVSFDLDEMFKVRDKEISLLSSGIGMLFSSAGIKSLQGVARVVGKRGEFFEISVQSDSIAQENVIAKKVVIAIGSEVAHLPNVPIDEDKIVSSDGALRMDVPKRLVVVGGGAIGLEMSSVWSRLGSEVVLVECSEKIAAGFDSDVSKGLLGCLQKQGIKFRLSSGVTGVTDCGQRGLKVACKSFADNSEFVLETDRVLVSIGRRPNVDGIVSIGSLELDNRGFVLVNKNYETSIEGVYAIGDVIGGAMLAHKAEVEGCAVAEHLVGNVSRVDYHVIPSVIYTHPAAASVGRGEEHLKSVSYEYMAAKSSFAANGRSRITCETDGFVKVVACKSTGVILGVHIVGSHADTLINEAAVALGYRATVRDICSICHSHPDVNEAFRDACEIMLHRS